MCVQVRREYEVSSLDPEHAGRFAAAALLNILSPADWQISSDVELVAGQYMHALQDRVHSGTAAVEVSVHHDFVEVAVSADDPAWVDERVRLHPRRPFASVVQCTLPDGRPVPTPRPTLWPALALPRTASARDEWSATWEALHEITQSIRVGGGDVRPTLDAVAAGVVKATVFTVAAVNLVIDSGDVEVVAVEGPPEAKESLLGIVEPVATWHRLFELGTPWGSLRYLPEDVADTTDDLVSWVPPYPPSDDPDLWNPLEMLIVPLYSADHTLVGVLSVDEPSDGRRPGVDDLERLEVFADHAATAIARAQKHDRLILD